MMTIFYNSKFLLLATNELELCYIFYNSLQKVHRVKEIITQDNL